jgi:hypothetical protein
MHVRDKYSGYIRDLHGRLMQAGESSISGIENLTTQLETRREVILEQTYAIHLNRNLQRVKSSSY